MVRKLFCSMVVMAVAIGFVSADNFVATITAVKDGKVTYQKYKKSTEKDKKGEKDGDEVTLPFAATGTVAKAGKYDKEAKKFEVGDKIEGGLKASVFAKIGDKGVRAEITTGADKKYITQILVLTKKKS